MNVYEMLNTVVSAATIDDGQVIYGWGTSQFQGIGDNEVIFFSWEEDYEAYSVTLTEDSIMKGNWMPDGAFLCEDSEGEELALRMFALTPVTPSSVQRIMHEAAEC
jgi:hypothetical protein